MSAQRHRGGNVAACLTSRCKGIMFEVYFKPLKSSGYYMYHQFNIHKFYVLPTQCIYMFCVDLRTNSDYFPIQH
jgi:hypothetical protein